jgi:hypothetical protein
MLRDPSVPFAALRVPEDDKALNRRAFLAAVGAGIGAMVLPSAACAAARATPAAPGINLLNVTYGRGTIPLLRSLGISRVRVTLYWSLWDSATGKTGSALYSMIDALRDAGIDVLVVCHAQGWDTLLPRYTLASATTAYSKFLVARASERQGITWQVMNEMDSGPYYSGPWFHGGDTAFSQRDRGEAYGKLLGPTYDAVKFADPSAKVITGGVALDDVIGFYSGVAATAKGKFDAFCVHVYGDPPLGRFSAKSAALRKVLGRTQLWCTEWGNNAASDTTQSAAIAACLDDNEAHNRYDQTYLFALQSGDNYRIVNSDGSRRRASEMVAARTRGRARP